MPEYSDEPHDLERIAAWNLYLKRQFWGKYIEEVHT